MRYDCCQLQVVCRFGLCPGQESLVELDMVFGREGGGETEMASVGSSSRQDPVT